LLKIRSQQQQTLADDHFIRRTVSFLRLEAPNETKDMSNQELRTNVERAVVTGREIGITSERELVRWALVGVLTRGAAYEDERIKGPLCDMGPKDQTKVAALLDLVAREIKLRAKR
jgi:hypothetical protein